MSTDGMESYREYYDLEPYLFDTVGKRFHQEGSLSTFDFFCIVIWKANRAKSLIAALLRRVSGAADLEDAVRQVTRDIGRQPSAKDRMRVLVKDWQFRLPMASAILTVLYPDEFTVYDDRVRRQVGCGDLCNVSDFDRLWTGYESFKRNVEDMTPPALSLRDKDRYLWDKSFHDQLTADIARSFATGDSGDASATGQP